MSEMQAQVTKRPMTGAEYLEGLRDGREIWRYGERADVMSINAPLSGETLPLIDNHALRRMKPTAFLSNTARGGLVDEDALAAAGLDVFHQEPLQHNPFEGLENVVLSPHLAAYSRERLREVGVMAAQSVATVLGGGPPILRSWSILNCISRRHLGIFTYYAPGEELRQAWRTSIPRIRYR